MKSSNPVLNTIKTIGSSPMYLIAAIAYSVALALQLLVLDGGAVDMGQLMPGGSEIVYQISQGIGQLIGSVPSILIAIGLWLMYAQCVSDKEEAMRTGGLSLMKASTIVSLVLMCIALGLALLGGLIVLILFSQLQGELVPYFEELIGEELGAAAGAIGVAFVAIVIGVVVLVAAVYIVYQAMVIKSINTVRKTATTGVPSDRVSGFVAVVNIIAGAISVISFLGGIKDWQYGFGAVADSLASICSGVAMILFGILLMNYRKEMRAIMRQQPVTLNPAAYAFAESATGSDKDTPADPML